MREIAYSLHFNSGPITDTVLGGKVGGTLVPLYSSPRSRTGHLAKTLIDVDIHIFFGLDLLFFLNHWYIISVYFIAASFYRSIYVYNGTKDAY